MLRVTGGGTDVALQDLGITGGQSFGEDGGGVMLAGNSLSLARCGVTGSSGGYYGFRDGEYVGYGNGGGIFAGANSRLTITDSTIASNSAKNGGGVFASEGCTVQITRSTVDGNLGAGYRFGDGGGLAIVGGSLMLEASTIAHNAAAGGAAGIDAWNSRLTITNSTIAGNSNFGDHTSSGAGGGIGARGGAVAISNSTVTGNSAPYYGGLGEGAGILVGSGTGLRVANTIVAGNYIEGYDGQIFAVDLTGAITSSNGHNVFGSDVAGNIAGDRENVAPGLLFAAVDPLTGGGQLNAVGVVPLRGDVTNPALSGGDRLATLATDQLGRARPQPADGLPDIGAAESAFAPSTTPSADNDVLAGTSGADTLSALAGHDVVRSLGGNDTGVTPSRWTGAAPEIGRRLSGPQGMRGWPGTGPTRSSSSGRSSRSTWAPARA